MSNEVIVERTTERKVLKPAPMTDELLSMIERFRGLDKDEMIKKFNRLAPGWIPYLQRVAKAAMLLVLRGEAPPPKVVVTPETELDDDINREILRSKPKSMIEQEIEKELRKDEREKVIKEMKGTPVKETPKIEAEPEKEPEANPFKIEEEAKDEEFIVAPVKVDGRKKSQAKKE